MDNGTAKELRRKLEEALDHVNAVREALEKPQNRRSRELARADLELAAVRIVGAITTVHVDA